MGVRVSGTHRSIIGGRSSHRATCRVRVAELKPLAGTTDLAEAGAGAEPSRDELSRELRAGHQRYAAVVSGHTVLFGTTLLSAAISVGTDSIEVVECDGCDGLCSGDLLLKAAGLYLRAALDHIKPDDFTARVSRARLYYVWARRFSRRPPRTYSPIKSQTRKRQRDQLIRASFGAAARTLQRDVALIRLETELHDLIRSKSVPIGAVEDLDRLPSYRQRELAARIKKGMTFAELKAEFLGESDGKRKTRVGAATAIRAALHAIAREARGRENCFRLWPDEYAIAGEVADVVHRWLQAPAPTRTLDEEVEHTAADLRGRGGQEVAAIAAKRGDRGATGGPR